MSRVAWRWMFLASLVLATSAADAAAGKISIVAFGDSTTAPRKVDGKSLRVYADILRDELPGKGINAALINAGVGGNTTAHAKKRFEKDVLSRKPQLVIIQFGANDAAVDVWKKPPATGPRVAIDKYEANLRSFIKTLRARGAAVILMTPNPFRWTAKLKPRYGKPPYEPDDPDGFNILLAKYGDVVRQIARTEKVTLVDVAAAFCAYGKKEGRAIDDLLLDGIHPNAKGHRLVADLLIPQIKALTATGRKAGQ